MDGIEGPGGRDFEIHAYRFNPRALLPLAALAVIIQRIVPTYPVKETPYFSILLWVLPGLDDLITIKLNLLILLTPRAGDAVPVAYAPFGPANLSGLLGAKFTLTGQTVFFDTEVAFAREVASHAVFMDNSTIIEQGSPQVLFYEAKEERTRKFLKQIYRS